MSDEKSLLSVTIDPSVDQDTAHAITIAVSVEQQRVLRAFAAYLATYDRDDSEYAIAGYNLLKQLIPELTDSVWQAVTGTAPIDGRCRHTPYRCCGWCGECDQHHEDGPQDEVCDRDYCHSCEHRCDY